MMHKPLLGIISQRTHSLVPLFKLLKEIQYPYQELCTPMVALEFLKNEKPQIMILDWDIPGSSGLDLACQIRVIDQQLHRYTYIFLFAEHNLQMEDCQKAIDIGVDDFLRFPPDWAYLWMRIQVACNILRYMDHIRELKSFIPICAYCKKIRTDQNYWDSLENFLATHMEVQIQLTVCPECANRYGSPTPS